MATSTQAPSVSLKRLCCPLLSDGPTAPILGTVTHELGDSLCPSVRWGVFLSLVAAQPPQDSAVRVKGLSSWILADRRDFHARLWPPRVD
jgi:hypothetical protein